MVGVVLIEITPKLSQQSPTIIADEVEVPPSQANFQIWNNESDSRLETTCRAQMSAADQQQTGSLRFDEYRCFNSIERAVISNEFHEETSYGFYLHPPNILRNTLKFLFLDGYFRASHNNLLIYCPEEFGSIANHFNGPR